MMNTTLPQTYGFPSLTVSEGEKNEDWHKKFVQAIINRSIMDGYANRYAIANECVNYYLGIQSAEEFGFLQRAEDGDVLPAQWENNNRIKIRIDILISELSQRGYDITALALNKEARVRKLQEKDRLRLEMRFQPIAQDLESEFGLPVQSQEGFIPQDEDELEDYMNMDYRELAEIIMKYAIKYLCKRNKWDYERIAMFRDILIQNMCFARNEIVNGIPVAKRVDPRLMIWDVNSTDDFLSDATYFGEIEYMPISNAADRYGLTKKEIEEVYQSFQNYNSNIGQAMQGGMSDFSVVGRGNDLKFFKQVAPGDLRVLVIRACWVDYKKISHEMRQDSEGGVHVKKVSDIASDGENKEIKRNVVQIWRKGTLIGGKILKEWGEQQNQVRNIDSLSFTEPPYKALIPNYLNQTAVSKVQQLKALQKLKDITMYNIQLAMARAGTKGIVYDIAQLPEEFDINRAIKYLKSVGIAFIDSTANGGAATFNQFKEFDLSLSQSVGQYLEISRMIDGEMDAISGINEARQGMVKGASQAVGVTQSALVQSSLSTAVYFDLFSQFCSNVLNYQAKLVKITFPKNKERFAPIIGDVGVNFLEQDIDLDLNDYGVFIEEHPPIIQDTQNFQQLVIAAVQAGQLGFADAMNLLMERDVKAGVRKLDRKMKKREEMAAQQQQEMMMAEQEQAQAAQAQAQEDNQMQMALKQMDIDGSMKEVLAKGRMDMKNNIIDFRKDLALAKMQKAIAKQKQGSSK